MVTLWKISKEMGSFQGAVFDKLVNAGQKRHGIKHKVGLYTLRHPSANLLLKSIVNI